MAKKCPNCGYVIPTATRKAKTPYPNGTYGDVYRGMPTEKSLSRYMKHEDAVQLKRYLAAPKVGPFRVANA